MKTETAIAIATAFALMTTPMLAEAKGARAGGFGAAGRNFESAKSFSTAKPAAPTAPAAVKPAAPPAAPATKAVDPHLTTTSPGQKAVKAETPVNALNGAGGGGANKPPAGGGGAGGGVGGGHMGPVKRFGAESAPVHSSNNWLLWYLLFSSSNNSHAHAQPSASGYTSTSSAHDIQSFSCQPSEGQSAQSWYLQCHSAAGGQYKLEFKKGCNFTGGESAQSWVQRCATKMGPDW